MLPQKNPSATRLLVAPANWDPERDGECGALEIADVVDEPSGNAVMESLWRPSPDELQALTEGGAVVLGIFGQSHPVVYAGVTNPPRHDIPPEKVPEDQVLKPEHTPTFSSTRGEAFSLAGQVMDAPHGRVQVADAPGLTTLLIKYPDKPQSNRVGVLLYSIEPERVGMVAQVDPAHARHVAASLNRLADQLDAEAQA